jgi:hypothetical protein
MHATRVRVTAKERSIYVPARLFALGHARIRKTNRMSPAAKAAPYVHDRLSQPSRQTVAAAEMRGPAVIRGARQERPRTKGY